MGRAVRRAVRVLSVVRVAGSSMAPTLRDGDCVLVVRGVGIVPGAVVVLRRPDRPDLLVVKRLVRRLSRGWWVAGDNPSHSDDSRTFGVVPEALVEGRVLVRYWPWRRGAPLVRRQVRRLR